MEIAGVAELDWSAPWFAAIAEHGHPISTRQDWRDELNRAAGPQRIAFVAGDAAGGEPYEAFIARTARIPTRDDLHDFFNALIWLRFPHAKAQLNRLQAAAIARAGINPVRGALRDALTLIDENSVLLVTRRVDLVESLRAHDWPRLFLRERAAWTTDISIVAFGHALLQKLARPYKSVTAHALHVPLAPDAALDEIDRCMATLVGDHLAPQDLMPLPVLGIPGWCAQNEEPGFYSDRTVFRPVNMRRQSSMEKQNETRRS